MRTYNEVSNPYQEKSSLEAKRHGQSYLAWLYSPRRSTADDLARLRKLWVEEPRVRAQLVQLAKAYRFHGKAALRLQPVPGCPAAVLQAVQGIIRAGLV
jgi:hypothetical protein